MGVLAYGKVILHGNFTKAKRYKNVRPKDWFDRDYKAIIPYRFKWRATWCKVVCVCKEMIEAYQPYYGSDWYHEEACAIMQAYKKHPTWANVAGEPRRIASSD